MKLFVDLDGVLTDFNKAISELLKHPIKKDFGNDPAIWKAIDKAGEAFWSGMSFMPDGHELWDYLEKYKPIVLTAPSNHPSSKIGKKIWLKENLPNVPYIIDNKKEKYAKDGYILIDDREKNIKKWREAGGIGILHKDAKSTIEKLKELKEKKEKESSDPPDYSIFLSSTPEDGSRYYNLKIPKDIVPPKEGMPLNINGVDLEVFAVRTPEDFAKGRGGLVARSMLKNGIGWDVNCLPKVQESTQDIKMVEAISKLDAIADELESLGMIREAYHLDIISGKWEDFLKAEKGNPVLREIKLPPKKLWDSGDKRLQTVKEVLDNIVRRKTGTHIPSEKLEHISTILKELQRMSVTDYTSQEDIGRDKKKLMDLAFSLDPTVAELIGLLFAKSDSKMERMNNENEISRLARPFLMPKRSDPFQSDFGRSHIFHEMARRANELDTSGLSDEHAKLVSACLKKLSNFLEKNASLEVYLNQFIDSVMKHRPSTSKVMEWIKKGNELYPVPPSVDKQKFTSAAWKKALSSMTANSKNILNRLANYNIDLQQVPEDPSEIKSWFVLRVAKALGLKSGLLAESTMPLEDWAEMSNKSTEEFANNIDTQ